MNDPILLQFPTGPVVEGRIPDDPNIDLPISLRIAIRHASRLKWCFLAEFCVLFTLGLTNLYLMMLPWIGIIGWFGVNNFQPVTLGLVAGIHVLLSISGSLCLGLQISSRNSSGLCALAFDIPTSNRALGQTVLVGLLLYALSAVGFDCWQIRTYILRNLAQEDRARLIALS